MTTFLLLLAMMALAGFAHAQYVPIPNEQSGPLCPSSIDQCSGFKVRADINKKFSALGTSDCQWTVNGSFQCTKINGVPIGTGFATGLYALNAIPITQVPPVDGQCMKYQASSNSFIFGGCGSGGGGTPGGLNTQVQVNNAGNFAGASGLTVNTGTGNVSTLTALGPISITGTQTNGGDQITNACVNGVCPVTAFGAVANNSNSGAAIQAALTAACVNNASVYFPASPTLSQYATYYPLIDSCSHTVNIYGDSRQTSIVNGFFHAFPVLVHYPSTYVANLGTFTGSSLVSGATQSLNFPAGNKFVVNLQDAMSNVTASQQPLNGLTGFTIDGWLNWAPSGNHVYTIFASGGNDGANPSAINPTQGNAVPATHLTISGDGSTAGQFTFALNIAGTLNTLNASAAVSKLTNHYFRAVLDPNGGTPKMCLYVDTAQVGSVLTVSGGTTIQQLPDETMTLGDYRQSPLQWPDPSPTTDAPFIGQIFPLRMSSSALNACSSATITVPSAPLANATNPIFLNNGDTAGFGTPALPSAPVIANEINATFPGYAVLRGGTAVTQGAAMSVHDLEIAGGNIGILDIASPTSVFRDLNFSGNFFIGLDLNANTYSSLVFNPICSNDGICINTTEVSDAEITNLQDTGSNYTFNGQTGGKIYGHISAPGGGNVGAGAVLSCQTQSCDYVLSGFGSDVESSANAIPIKIVSIGGKGNYLIQDSDLQTASSANAPGIYYNNFGLGTGKASITLVNTHYEGGAPSELVHFLSGTNPFTWITPVINGHQWSANTIPVTDEALNFASIVGDQGPITSMHGYNFQFNGSGGSAIPAAASANAHQRACVSDGLTACTANNTYAAADGAQSCEIYSTGSVWAYSGSRC